MTLPGWVRAELSAHFGDVCAVHPVSGGCVSDAYRIETASGVLFLKYDSRAPAGFFDVEATGLESLRREARGLRVPSVAGRGSSAEGPSWIALEWLQPVAPTVAAWSALGAGLAELHRAGVANSVEGGLPGKPQESRADQGARRAATGTDFSTPRVAARKPASAGSGPSHAGWGHELDGFIGRLPQANSSMESWPDFWWERRLRPQLELAVGAGLLTDTGDWDRLRAILPRILDVAAEEGPSILHGDLWSGNVLATTGGPALIDPALYRGHREVDIAMTLLFGGFHPVFHDAYTAGWPLKQGFDLRCAVYQLYYLLVHVNLFGASYVGRTRETLARALVSI